MQEREGAHGAGDSGKNQVHNKAPTPTKVSAASKTRVFHEVQYTYVEIAIKFILDFAMMFTKKTTNFLIVNKIIKLSNSTG